MNCFETGKVIHLSRGHAEAALKSLQVRFEYVGHIYPCVYCKGWHIGREKKNCHKNKYK